MGNLPFVQRDSEYSAVMIEVACQCSWDIPGIDALPPHSHVGIQHKVRWTNGRESVIPDYMLGMNPGQKRCIVLETYPESIRIWVTWRDVARALSVVSPLHAEEASPRQEEAQAS